MRPGALIAKPPEIPRGIVPRVRRVGCGALAALLLLISACGEAPREAGAGRPQEQGAGTGAPASAEDLLGAMLTEPTAQAVLATLADERPQAWLARLEAIRIARRDRPAGGAALLCARARGAASPFEQAAALEALAYGYPAEAATLLPRLAGEFAGAREDGRRLVVAALRGRIAAADPAIIDLLDHDSEQALFTLRAEIIAGGEAMAEAIAARAPLDARRDLLWALLAHAARAQGGSTQSAPAAAGPPEQAEIEADAQAITALRYPAPDVVVFGESRGASAIPLLRRCLADAGAEGRIEAATELGADHDAASASAILALLASMPDDPRRAPLLVALGALAYAPAELTLVEAAHDRTQAVDADGVRVMPISQAALAALGSFHGAASHDALITALGRSDRPRAAVVAARSLRARGDKADLEPLYRAHQLMVDAGEDIAAAEIRDAYEELYGEPAMVRDQHAWLVSYHLAGRDCAILTDYPLMRVDEPYRVVAEERGQASISQRTVPMARQEIRNAIELRNKDALARLHLAGAARTSVDQVDLLAR